MGEKLDLDGLERAAETARMMHLAIPGAADDPGASGVVLTPEQVTALIALAREAEGAKRSHSEALAHKYDEEHARHHWQARAEKAEARVAELEAELAALRHDIERYVGIAADQAEEIVRGQEVAEAFIDCHALIETLAEAAEEARGADDIEHVMASVKADQHRALLTRLRPEPKGKDHE